MDLPRDLRIKLITGIRLSIMLSFYSEELEGMDVPEGTTIEERAVRLFMGDPDIHHKVNILVLAAMVNVDAVLGEIDQKPVEKTVDWSKAPDGAKYYDPKTHTYYKEGVNNLYVSTRVGLWLRSRIITLPDGCLVRPEDTFDAPKSD